MENNKDIKLIIANNIIKYRKEKGLTQLELAEMLNYSDKTLSKWERAEAIPDIITLKQLSEIFEVSVEVLISDEYVPKFEVHKPKKGTTRKKVVSITLLSLSLVWLVATFSFVLLAILDINSIYFKPWFTFIFAVPISAIILLVFSCIWGNEIDRFVSTSALMWTLAMSLSISMSYINKIYLLYIICIPLQVMAFLYFCIYKRKK